MVAAGMLAVGGLAVRAGLAGGRPGPPPDPAARRGPAVRPRGAGRVPAHGTAARPRGHREPAAGRREGDRADPRAPAPRGDRPGPALRSARMARRTSRPGTLGSF